MDEFQIYDQPKMTSKMIEHILNCFSEKIESAVDSDLIYFNGRLTTQTVTALQTVIEATRENGLDNGRLAIILNSSGGEPDKVYRLVDEIRTLYKKNVMFIIPTYAISAGTLLAFSGDEIYLTETSGLGSIDTQIEQKDGSYIPFAIYKERGGEIELPQAKKEKLLTEIKYYKYLAEQNAAISIAGLYLRTHLFARESLTAEKLNEIQCGFLYK